MMDWSQYEDERVKKKLDQIVKISYNLIEKGLYLDYDEKLNYKGLFTPLSDYLDLLRSELKNLQKKFLKLKDEFFEPARNAIENKRDFIRSKWNPTEYPSEFIESAEEWEKNWIEHFYIDYIQFNDLNNDSLFTEILRVGEIESQDDNMNLFVDDLVDFPRVQEVVDILISIQYFETIFDLFHEIQKGTDIPNLQKQLIGCKLNNDQIDCLFEELVSDKYISSDTNQNFFRWVFCYTGKARPLGKYFIKWLQKKNALRDLLNPILGNKITRQHERDIELIFLDEYGKPLKMNRPKEVSGKYMEITHILERIEIISRRPKPKF